MADIGQKFRFDPRRLERFIARFGQLHLESLAVGDVEDERQYAAFALQFDQLGGAETFANFSGPGAEGAFDVAERAAIAEALHKSNAVVGAHPHAQLQGRAANDLLARISHQLQKAVVHVDETPFRQRGDGNRYWTGEKRFRKELLRLVQLFFRPFALRDVARVDHDGLDAGLVQEVGSGALHPMPRAVLVADTIMRGDGAAWLMSQVVEQLFRHLDVVGMDKFKCAVTDDLNAGVTQISECCRFSIVEDGSFWVDEGNGIRAFLDQRPEAALACFKDLFSFPAPRDVLDDSQRVKRFAVAAADQGGGQMRPNDALALCDVTFFQLITGSLLVE